MQNPIVGVYDATSGEFIRGFPYIYNGTTWERVLPKVYIAGWQDIGGAGELFYKFLEYGGNYYNSTDQILVREGVYDKLIDCNGQPIVVTDNKVTTGDPAHANYVFQVTVKKLNL